MPIHDQGYRRYGGTRADYRRINATGPSLWAYAHRAGLRTVYIDAQRTGGALHNEMSGAERTEIDEFVQFDRVPVRNRDMAAADRLAGNRPRCHGRTSRRRNQPAG